ncbi:MAG: M3 family oligoendopeptidase [Flavobacteriales bacterium]|nr:M3 family oligoendopeptidase [Flavobacteriales bacterium]
MHQTTTPVRQGRDFLPDDLVIDSWTALEPYFQELLQRSLVSEDGLHRWVSDLSELEAVLSEETGWRYIRMSIDTKDVEARKAFEFLVTEIDPKVAPYNDLFNRKLLEAPLLRSLTEEGYFIYLRAVRKQVEMFREANIPLQTKMQQLQQQYGAITGGMSIEHNGHTMTLQMAVNLLKDTDRDLRRSIYDTVSAERLSKADELDAIFNQLVKVRHEVAQNAGYANFRDYKFDALGRFDYGVKECIEFHGAIAAECAPLIQAIDTERKTKLKLEKLRPWDLDVDADGKVGLQPFDNEQQLIDRTIACFTEIRPSYGEYLSTMQAMGHLDLGSRLGKAPGGFNYPLYETGVPFIFMNSVGCVRDLVTMVHEGGHAVHSFLSRDLPITSFKSLPSEVAELASMGMELISLDHWHIFFDDESELKRAKKEHLSKIISVLPWVATIDSFQHWVYEHPEHTVEERDAEWSAIFKRFGSAVVDFSGLEPDVAKMWQKQLHIFEVPFYYIEYAIAQLGAIAVWRNYRDNPEQALDRYEAALSLGYTRTIGEIYAAAGIRFDFSRDYVHELMQFVWSEYNSL